jgi:hypothetical protein
MSTPRNLANRMAARGGTRADDGFHRETFTLPREAARLKAKEQFRKFPRRCLHDEDRSLAAAAGRHDRVHHASPEERGLSGLIVPKASSGNRNLTCV